MKANQSYDNGSSEKGSSIWKKISVLLTPSIQKLSENWGVKAICVVIAIIIYLFYQMSLVKTQSFVIPLSVSETGGVEHVSPIQNSVKVTVRTKSDTNVHADDFSAKLDLNYYTQSGVYDIPVILEISNQLVQVDPVEVKVKPEKISVHVEQKISTAVSVDVSFVGTPAHGFEITDYSVSPESVVMSGPESVITKVSKVMTQPVLIDGIASSKKITTGLEKLNHMINLEENGEYVVNVQVAPVITQKEIKNVSPILKNKSSDFEYLSLSRDLCITVTGPMVTLENMDDDAAFFDIDLSSVPIEESGEYVFPINVNLPKQVSVAEKSFSEWKIKAVKKEPVIETETSLELPQSEAGQETTSDLLASKYIEGPVGSQKQ